MGTFIGYARVSTGEQDVQLQVDALQQAGCEAAHIFIDKASGARSDRPGLEACLAVLQPEDTLVVWRLDRLGRSMPHLVTLVEELLRKKIGFRSLCDGVIDQYLCQLRKAEGGLRGMNTAQAADLVENLGQ